MGVRIVIDSTCDLPQDVRAAFDVVPLTISFGNEEFVDGVVGTHAGPGAYAAAFLPPLRPFGAFFCAPLREGKLAHKRYLMYNILSRR